MASLGLHLALLAPAAFKDTPPHGVAFHLAALAPVAYVAVNFGIWRKWFSNVVPRSDPTSRFHGPRELANDLRIGYTYMSFVDFLWGQIFVGTNSILLWATGVPRMLVRQMMHRRGWGAPPEYDPKRVVGELLMETISNAVHYTDKWTEGGVTIGRWRYTEFPWIAHDALVVSALFEIHVDLERKVMLKAVLDGRAISASDVMPLVFMFTAHAHAKMHCLANWGINLEDRNSSSYMRRMAVVTNVYNFFGSVVYCQIFKLFHRLGLCADHPCLWRLFRHLAQHEPARSHRQIRELGMYSEMVRFVMAARQEFSILFAEHRHEFPGADAEGMFVGTILHSLDHASWERAVKDPLVFNSDSPIFGAAAEIARFSRAGFVEDIPGLLFNCRLKHAPGMFHRKLYRRLASINVEFADLLDTCIVK